MIAPQATETKHWSFHTDLEKIGWLTIHSPEGSVNVLSREAIMELETLVARIEDLANSKQLVGVVLLSGKDSGFIAGADVSEFDGISEPSVLTEALKRTHALFWRIENLKVPVVAGIHGFCLGGGLELALACHYRIAVNDDKTRIGFPEVNLGIFPGFGGTGRSIRQAGPVDAMQIMLTGKMLRAGAARGLNLVDKLVRHRDMLRWEGRKAVLQSRRSSGAGWTKKLTALPLVREAVANQMRKQAGKKARREHYPAPYALIDLFEKHGNDWQAMVRGEIDAFVPLMGSPTATNLRRVFFLSEGLKKQGLKGAKFARVHVIGAGVMGGDIAAWCAYRGMSVTLQDLDMARIQPALDRAKKLFQKRYRKKREVDAAMLRLTADPQGSGVPRADVIIEAVVEKLEVKQSIFSGVEGRMKPGAIMATNTSSIELERIAEALKEPGRLIGLHFFNPVAQLPLVEVIRSRFNSDEAIARGASFALAIGKSPVVVKSAPGFLVNRVLMPYMLGAVERVEKGESKELLDAAAVAFGMPMGPIELMDTVGLDVGKSVATELGHSIPADSRFARLIAEGKLGRKTGEGFYKWEKGKAVKGETPAHADLAALGRELVKPLVDMTEVVVEEGVVGSADLADVGVIMGTGFAPFLGGPMRARADGRA
ncbi:3-hydroxyacyl-CoA dehydrogenase NAD-binding domain-containing protein [Devosia sp. 63-57]|uniref:3-hydroxyacyl-CoA dehydrogenase NAD-binding domain-containing protein n=1 Tax=Devosia sp. 63-57 TaxID=1895751 RepID=UPI000869611A|nr:3-hydroxyacyl-CoA dehydrogenase NAD-binding domain-containing protein [Devosia sp. 63-57]ODT48961.1 MAG: 3-hydroxyacyl-CoA dehydrogenase [Pelagibacterium sp. SCN 63-126]ODU89354.1 MAG: 3-hydroxyacyl-CoA dehydrogenase [Pelagibacterium sp. SCN 63-17]OJX44109.1 MAG: 3-hydroxyacyl-CoA dehydrogenase [Devosia sp. 63-57]